MNTFMEQHSNAFYFAFGAHAAVGQRRKYTGEPYINHPVAVTYLLLRHGFEGDIIKAALLHDVVEDTKVELIEISDLFGPRVAQLVGEVTDASKQIDGNRAVRKELDVQHIARASYEGKSLKLADLINNTCSIVEHDKAFAVIYLKEKEALLEVLSDGHAGLFALAQQTLADGWEKLGGKFPSK